MTPFATKRLYLAAYIVAAAVIALTHHYGHTNIFGETGATLVVLAIWRGSRELHITRFGGKIGDALVREGNRVSLGWDVTAAMIGTAINGYSKPLYAGLCYLLPLSS